MKIILDITDEEYEVLRDYGTSLKSEDGARADGAAQARRGAGSPRMGGVEGGAEEPHGVRCVGVEDADGVPHKKTGTGNLSVKVHGTGRTAVKADLEI